MLIFLLVFYGLAVNASLDEFKVGPFASAMEWLDKTVTTWSQGTFGIAVDLMAEQGFGVVKR